MINIRTITYNMPAKLNKNTFEKVSKCIKTFRHFNYKIRTTRISSCEKVSQCNYYDLINKFCLENDIKWFSINVDENQKELVNYCYKLVKKYERAFINIDGSKDGLVNFKAIDSYIKTAKKVATISENGQDNFRLGLSINIGNNFPFFPFAKSNDNLSFSIGLELTEEINKIIDDNKSLNLNELREIIIKSIDRDITAIENYALKVENKYDIHFDGFDFSLAPTLEENGSIVKMIQKLGVKELNGSGSFFATAYLTNILKSFGNNHRHIGFSGLMYSLLEDNELCNINNSDGVRLEDLIKLSTMCGCGIDMFPIHSSTDNDIIKNYILDICAISCRLTKPLGVRFIIVPDCFEKTEFTDDADFITNTKVVKLSGNVINTNDMGTFNLIKLKNLY